MHTRPNPLAFRDEAPKKNKNPCTTQQEEAKFQIVLTSVWKS